MSDSSIDCYLLHETENARRVQLKETDEQTWIPKSVCKYCKIDPIPEDMEGKIPGKPTILEVASWFMSKNPELSKLI
jgi:hypothetical protein